MIYVSIRKKDEISIDEDISFPKNITREESRKAYSLLKKMVDFVGVDFDISKVRISKNGKPYFIDNRIKFNYSHSTHYIACILSDCEVGIDIEDDFKISKEAAFLYLNQASFNLRYQWVMKEAYFKFKGDFSEDEFKKLRVEDIDSFHHIIENDRYLCVAFCEKEDDIVFFS